MAGFRSRSHVLPVAVAAFAAVALAHSSGAFVGAAPAQRHPAAHARPAGLAARTRRAAEGRAEEKKDEKAEPNFMDKIKRFGPAGIASYAITEGLFWIISIPGVCLFYTYATGEVPNLTNQEDQAKVFGASFAFLNVARLVVPLRVGVALALAPWVDENVVKPFFPEQWEAWQAECNKTEAAADSKA